MKSGLVHVTRLASLVSLISLPFTLAGCSKEAERPVLEQFFGASRLRDRTFLRPFATVIFEPRIQGTINAFDIRHVGSEQPRAVNEDVVSLSLADPGHPADPTSGPVALFSKEVTIEAPVRLPDGSSATKTVVITLARAKLTGPQARTGRWIVTGFREGTS